MSTASVNDSGWSRLAKCDAPGRTTSAAPAMAAPQVQRAARGDDGVLGTGQDQCRSLNGRQPITLIHPCNGFAARGIALGLGESPTWLRVGRRIPLGLHASAG